jgi:hypothetical protein
MVKMLTHAAWDLQASIQQNPTLHTQFAPFLPIQTPLPNPLLSLFHTNQHRIEPTVCACLYPMLLEMKKRLDTAKRMPISLPPCFNAFYKNKSRENNPMPSH